MTTGVLYIVWGDKQEQHLARSIASLKKWHPELPTYVHRCPPDSDLRVKAQMYELSPYDLTLYLDADTVVMGDISFGFKQALRHGLACCVCECPWARRYCQMSLPSDQIEYNTGVMFFDREGSAGVFETWKTIAPKEDSSIVFLHHRIPGAPARTMPINDQGSFARAVADLEFSPFILPLNWNLRPEWHRVIFGPVKVWHDRRDPFPHVVAHTEQQNQPGSIIDVCNVW